MTTLIGYRWKACERRSRVVLITRTLPFFINQFFPLALVIKMNTFSLPCLLKIKALSNNNEHIRRRNLMLKL